MLILNVRATISSAIVQIMQYEVCVAFSVATETLPMLSLDILLALWPPDEHALEHTTVSLVFALPISK